MSDRELLRISLSPAQVRDACAEYASKRANIAEPHAVRVEVFGDFNKSVPDPGPRAEVVFTKKRVRKAKA